MADERIAGVDGDGCIRRLEFLPVEGGETVLLKITGWGLVAIELELSQLIALTMEARIAHTRALSLRADLRERLATVRERLASATADAAPDDDASVAEWGHAGGLDQ